MARGRSAGHNAARRPGLHGHNGGVTPARAASTRGLSATDDDVFVLRVSPQVALDVWTDRDDPQLAPACIVEREPDQRGPDTLALVFGQHLGVHEGDPTVLDEVLEDAGELAVEAGLVAGALGARR